jgi:hypothetical protein
MDQDSIVTLDSSAATGNLDDDSKLLVTPVDARQREYTVNQMQTASWLTRNIAPILALLSVMSIFGLFFYLVVRRTSLDPALKEVLMYIFGVLSVIVSQIYSYYFGSSSGSKSKQEQIFKSMNGQ